MNIENGQEPEPPRPKLFATRDERAGRVFQAIGKVSLAIDYSPDVVYRFVTSVERP